MEFKRSNFIENKNLAHTVTRMTPLVDVFSLTLFSLLRGRDQNPEDPYCKEDLNEGRGRENGEKIIYCCLHKIGGQLEKEGKGNGSVTDDSGSSSLEHRMGAAGRWEGDAMS